MCVAEELKRKRISINCSIAELSVHTDIDEVRLNDFEHGKVRLTLKELEKVCVYLTKDIVESTSYEEEVFIDYSKFKLRLKQLRNAVGLSQRSLAALVGIDSTTISRYEKGIVKPNVDKISLLASALEVDSDYLKGATDVLDNVNDISDLNYQLWNLESMLNSGQNVSFNGNILSMKDKQDMRNLLIDFLNNLPLDTM